MANFKEIKVTNVEGEVELVDFSKQIGNLLYTQGKDVAVCEAGQEIYHGNSAELNDEAKELIRQAVSNMPYIYRKPLLEAID